MQLIELRIVRGGSVIRNVAFKQGLNLILDKPTAISTQSGNSVGKTTVLRLIDFCFGSEGDDIWQDPEFKTVNQEVFDFLHSGPTSIVLTMQERSGAKHTLTRFFTASKQGGLEPKIDTTPYKAINAYRKALKELLFSSSGDRPRLRQLMPKFIRSSPILMSKTLKFLGDYATASEYEALHLFLFGFFAVEVLEERPTLSNRKTLLERDLQALNRLRKEGEIEQILIHLRRQIEEISQSAQVRGEVPEIAARANAVTEIRSRASAVAGDVSRYASEIAALRLTIQEFQNEYSNVDTRAIEAVYRDARAYIPQLHHDWDDLTDFVKNLRGRKQRFLESQIHALQERADTAQREFLGLQEAEKNEIGSTIRSPEFSRALELRSDLQEKLKQLGSLEQNLQDLKNLKAQIAETETRLKQTQELVEKEKANLQSRVSIFNKYFSELSKVLYGEQYLLHFDETAKGLLSFQLTSVGSNVGVGKKASQTAAFDLAYVQFLKDTGINFPKFVCHDGLEQIHANQLSALLTEANQIDGQLVLATLRDKLPNISDEFLKQNTILELSQDEKLFRM